MISKLWLLLQLTGLLVAQPGQFPAVKDWATLRITLSRSGCFGSCPEYEVEIHGDGQVRYNGMAFVSVRGVHDSTVTRQDLELLIEGFRNADFFALNSEYRINLSDGSTYKTSLSIDGQTKSVLDYGGRAVGMPSVVTEVEQAVDRIENTGMWVRGDEKTVEALRREGFDFKTQEGGRILAWASGAGDRKVVRDLIDAGVPLDIPTALFILQAPSLVHAISNNDPEVLRMLVEAGASKTDSAAKQQALEAARRKGDRQLVALLETY